MNREKLIEELRAISVEGKDVKEIYIEISQTCMKYITETKRKRTVKNAYYFSIEFLMGRAIYDNLLKLGILDDVKRIFAKKGFDLNSLEEVEDAALGNGGLGRLAACFLDSAAAQGYPVHGYGIRYRYGLFRQRFANGEQVEEDDDWLKWGDPWSERKESETRLIRFADMPPVKAVPYDIPVLGKTNNTLRLFQAEGSAEAEEISKYLYPADDTEEGKLLRIRQEYFFTAVAIGELIDQFTCKNGKNFKQFSEFNSIQLNDTHPVFAIAEFIRILTTVHGVPFYRALNYARDTFNYTNHTILPEALECWDEKLIEKILPEIAQILKSLHVYSQRKWRREGCSQEEIEDMSLLKNGRFSMANTAVFVAKKINGVAEIHSEIIKQKLFRTAYKYSPDKFTNVTNGVTPRRWLRLCNEELAKLYDSNLGLRWRFDMTELTEINTGNKHTIEEFRNIKTIKKEQLARYIEQREGIRLLPNAIYASQIKRLHEYKRQLMTAFAILYLYYELKDGNLPDFTPTVFIFGAKAAKSYRRAKSIIKYINEIAELVNGDQEVNHLLQVVFVQNYDVSYAEKIIPGTDASLQVSTAGYEASGTGNMKFMMNGAVTVGTLDGANIEIKEAAGEHNNYIFGAKVEEIEALADTYNPMQYVEQHPKVKRVADTLIDGTFEDDAGGLEELHTALFKGASWHKPDNYAVLFDLESYVDALLRVNRDYKDNRLFAKKQLVNATHSAFFSSDRAIETYAKEIWKIVKA